MEYVRFAGEKISQAICDAWNGRKPSGMAYGLGHAVVGRNRRLSYKDGKSAMYGEANVPEFSHVEGYEDHSVYAMMTYDISGKLIGIIVNIACPSQVSENSYAISADFWHETREELRRRFGKDIYIMAQCGPAGYQSPHLLIGKRAEERMWRLKGRKEGENAPREEISQKITNAIEEMMSYVEKDIDWDPVFEYSLKIFQINRRRISEKDVEDAIKASFKNKEKFNRLAEELKMNPEITKKPRWYTEITRSYRLMLWGERVKERFEIEKKSPSMPIEIHVLRVGETAFATNTFELYLDYGVRIRELSRATQTFLIQKACCLGTYLPSQRSIDCGGYGSDPASTDIGPEGGDELVEWTVDTINKMFE
jgi:hypothetical protein